MNKLGWKAKGTTITQRELDVWIAARARPGEEHEQRMQPDEVNGFVAKREYPIVKFGPEHKKGSGSEPVRKLIHGKCPCAVCGHTYEAECEKLDCHCCRGCS